MTRAVHRPLEVDAVRWDGDLLAMRELAIGDVDIERDSMSGTLWVTQNLNGHREVFPVAFGHWLVREKPSGRLVGMSPRQFEHAYAIVAA